MSELLADLRYALRSLSKSPGFSLVAILTLALGVGANSAIFSVLNGVVLRPLPYPQSDELVRVASKFSALGFEKFWLSPPEYFELGERNRSFSEIGAYRTGTVSVGGDDAAVRVTVASATHTLFRTLGVPALLGRAYTQEQDLPNTEPVAVLSYELWQNAFGGDPAIVGRNILVNGNQVTVTGVMPAGFDVADSHVELWLPMGLDRTRQNRGTHFLDVVARLRPGVTLEQAQADLARLVRQWGELEPNTHVPEPENHPIFAVDLQDDVIGNAKSALLLLFGAVSFVLLIACANVANLLLARAESRQKEIALRSALGAGKTRLLRQFLTEGVVLSLGGAIAGLFLGYAGVWLLLATNPDGIPRASAITIDGRVLSFTLVVAIITGLIFGLAPALHLGGRTVTASLRDGGGRTTAGAAGQRIRRLLVVTEVALAVMLVIGSGLMLRSFDRLLEVDPGFEPDGLLTFQLFLPAAGYVDPPAQVAFYQRLIPTLEALPGVTAVSMMEGLPPRREVNANDIVFEDVPQTPGGPPHNIDFFQYVGPDYLETMKIPMLDGRTFTHADEGGNPVVLINERLARTFYPNTNPIGRRLRMPGPPGSDRAWFTIAGIVQDVKQRGVEAETGTELYFYYPQLARMTGLVPRTMNVVVRTSGNPMALALAARSEVMRLDPTVPVADVAPMTEVLSNSMARPRFLAMFLGVFAAVALGLAAIGTYGVMAYSVAERRQEIGIRMALGAQAGQVMRMIFSDGLVIAGLGLAIGIGGAFTLTSLLQSMLFNVSPTDPLSFAAAPVILAVVSLLACYVPARRAMRVDPARTLKPE